MRGPQRHDAFVAGASALFLCAHLALLRPAVEDIDSINFALGATDYDLSRHQPHPPGYPVFILTVRAVAFLVGPVSGPAPLDAALLALVLVSAVCGAATIALLYSVLLASGLARRTATLASLTFAAAPLVWVQAARPLSDSAGLAAALLSQLLLLRLLGVDRIGAGGCGGRCGDVGMAAAQEGVRQDHACPVDCTRAAGPDPRGSALTRVAAGHPRAAASRRRRRLVARRSSPRRPRGHRPRQSDAARARPLADARVGAARRHATARLRLVRGLQTVVDARGWMALTRELAGLSHASGMGPSTGGATAWVRRSDGPVTVVIGGRHVGTPAEALTLDVALGDWVARCGRAVDSLRSSLYAATVNSRAAPSGRD